MTAGFIYVLINPTMPGLAKVGKTTRDPSNRVGELSGATGVATPFILAYQQPVADCHAAEAWVHSQLELKGQRVASNREFFNAPLHEIVGLVNMAAGAKSTGVADEVEDSVGLAATVIDELMESGMTYMRGDGVIENWATALKYFSQASAMGDPGGSTSAGICLQFGSEDLRQDPAGAIEFYRKGIAQGHWQNHGYVAIVFHGAESNENASREWRTLFEKAIAIVKRKPSERAHVCELLSTTVGEYLRNVAVDVIPNTVPNELVLEFRTEMIASLEMERSAMKNYGQNGMAIQFLQRLA